MLLFSTTWFATDVSAWSNGGYSNDPSNPDYGTHDWIAQHALDWLPEEEKQYILNNLVAYLYGTELPDNGGAPDGIGDMGKHHIYYWSNGSLQEDDAAVRASEEYYNALSFLESGDFANASKTAGIMSHYIVDVAVFCHVMGSGTDWGKGQNHSKYEGRVNTRTDSYEDEFNSYLAFDDVLAVISAYDAATQIAYDTTFDVDGDLTCVWMNQNYNWSNPTFIDRCGESLNLAVNFLTDVLHTLYLEAHPLRDVAVVGVTTSKTVVGAGFSVTINTTVENQGDYSETFDVIAYYNTTPIETQTIGDLIPDANVALTFIWDTTGVAKGNYTISAKASTVPGEIDTADNEYVDGIVQITIAGDINGDVVVDLHDLTRIGRAYGATPQSSSWDEPCDINNDNVIDFYDLAIYSKNYGKTDP
ncbi:MAG: zinc dependent phospholipase C family protein [Candidatus Bathyarchaeota archaeon]|nr:zinc dependent phospholipase C family protein [Candidatus Bathyarchaeota archaeon]